MMRDDFRVWVRGEKKPDKSLERPGMLKRADAYIDNAKKAKTRTRSWRNDRTRPKGTVSAWRQKMRVRRLTRGMAPGQRVHLEADGSDRLLVIFKLEARRPSTGEHPDLGCAPQLEKAHWYLWDRFGEPQLRSAGRWLCKFVLGTTTVSRHGYLDDVGAVQWKGAAEDVFGEGDLNSMDGLIKIAHWLIKGHTDGLYKLRRIIVGDRSWTPSGGWEPYTGEFHTHVHYEVEGGHACHPVAA